MSKKKNLVTKEPDSIGNQTSVGQSNQKKEDKAEAQSDKTVNSEKDFKDTSPEEVASSDNSLRTNSENEVITSKESTKENSIDKDSEKVETKVLAPKEERKKVVFGSSFSIKETMKKHTEEREEEEKTDEDAFTAEQLLKSWKAYAEIQNEQGRKTFYTALTKNFPELKEDFVIVLTLENKTLFDNFNREKQELTDYLKKELNNYSIAVQSELIKSEEEEVFLYTDKEKFKKIAEDHPELLYLKDKLHLDFEF